MRLNYCVLEGGNFGDDMNAWFWDAVFPRFREMRPDYTLFGIGSILGKDFLAGQDRFVVLGSGTGYGAFPKPLPEHAYFGWVRGPLTAKNLGLDEDRWITDPAALVARMETFRSSVDRLSRPIFIPHRGMARVQIPWDSICANAGLDMVTPAAESKGVIQRIAKAPLVITESLHGAIIADALRVPWIPIALSPSFNSYKWEDWGQSMQMTFEIAPALVGMKRALHFSRRARNLVRSAPRHKRDPATSPTPPAHQPQGRLQSQDLEYKLSGSEGDRLRRIARLATPLLAYQITRDLRAAARRTPYLSEDNVLERRLQQMEERLHDVERVLPDLP